MASKRYFFVHLAIFAGLCSTFAISGLSSYRDYLKKEQISVAAQSQGAGEETALPDLQASRDSRAVMKWSDLDPAILALSDFSGPK